LQIQIFLGTPHRFESAYDAEDQLCKLVLLPGPDIGGRTLSKVRELARQVTRVNKRFLATKILDRAAIFNVFTHRSGRSSKQNPIDEATTEGAAPGLNGGGEDDDAANLITPFPRYTHHQGHSFEAAGRFLEGIVQHADLTRGQESTDSFSVMSGLFNVPGFCKS
jgi:hypothetical protein